MERFKGRDDDAMHHLVREAEFLIELPTSGTASENWRPPLFTSDGDRSNFLLLYFGVQPIPFRLALEMQSDSFTYDSVDAPTMSPLRAVRRHLQPSVL